MYEIVFSKGLVRAGAKGQVSSAVLRTAQYMNECFRIILSSCTVVSAI